jgi:hypothetical protein
MLGDYVASSNMYGRARVFSNPFSNMPAEPFKTSVNELYSFMLQKCLNRTREYEYIDDWDSLDLAMLKHMQREIHETNPLSVILDNDAYYFSDSKVMRRIDKYESN